MIEVSGPLSSSLQNLQNPQNPTFQDFQLIFNIFVSHLLLITYLLAQCSKKPEEPAQLKEPPYPMHQPPPRPGVLPTEDMYIYFNAPYKNKPDVKPPQDKIAEMIAVQEAAKDPEIRRKWGEEYCKAHPTLPKDPNKQGPSLDDIVRDNMERLAEANKKNKSKTSGHRTRASKSRAAVGEEKKE